VADGPNIGKLQEAIQKRQAELAIVKEQLRQEHERFAALQQSNAAIEDQRAAYERVLGLKQNELDSLNQISATQQQIAAARSAELETLRQTAGITAEQLATKQQEYSTSQATADQLRSQAGILDQILTKQRKAQQITNDLAASTRNIVSSLTGMDSAWQSTFIGTFQRAAQETGGFSQALSVVGGEMSAMATPMNAMAMVTMKVVESTIGLIARFDELKVGFRTATGAGREYDVVLEGVSMTNRQFGVSLSEAQGAMSSLYTEMSQFSHLGRNLQVELSGLVAKMSKAGVSGSTAAANMDTLTKTFGMGIGQAKQFSMDMVQLGTDIGIPPKKLAQELGALAPRLAQYGSTATNEFRKLAAQAKATGMEMQRLIGISQGFDTFEDAAQKVGALNAILGGPYLNTVTMMMATDSQRLQIVRQSIIASGRYAEITDKAGSAQSRFLAKAIAMNSGIQDTDSLMRLLNNDLGQFSSEAMNAAGSEERLNDVSMQNTTIMQKMAISIEQLAVGANQLSSGISNLMSILNNTMATTTGIIGVFAALTGGTKLLGMAMGRAAGEGAAQALANTQVASTATSATGANAGLNASLATTAPAARTASVALRGFGIQAGALLVGVGAAAAGIGLLVGKFRGMGDQESTENIQNYAGAMNSLGSVIERMPTDKVINVSTAMDNFKETINAVVRLEGLEDISNTVRLVSAASQYSAAIVRAQDVRDPLKELINAIRSSGGGGQGRGGPVNITMKLNNKTFGTAVANKLNQQMNVDI
tara:strand:+ start:20161 stop:22452 length:2292 start_codon:yes stop_codon:yes gene_type:complete